jgi:glycosidase
MGNDLPAVPASYANRTEPVNSTVTHDEQSLIYEMNTFQSVPLAEAIQRDKLYATFMFTSLGIPMLWQGMEFSAPRGWVTDGEKLSYRPVEWSLYSTARGRSHFHYYHTLIQQRRYNPALYNGVLRKLYRYEANKVLVWGLEDATSGSTIMTVANLSGVEQTISNVPWLEAGTWYDVFNQDQFIVTDTIIPGITIPAYTALVYSNKTDSALGIITSIEEQSENIPDNFSLSQNYPNPFNPSTHFTFQVADVAVKSGSSSGTELVSLKVFDMLGREVANVLSRQLQPGTYTVSWDAGSLSSGVYFYRLTTSSGSLSKKMMLLR